MAIAPGLLMSLVIGSMRRVTTLRAGLAHRRSVRQLSALDDRALKDIGLARSEVDSALYHPLTRNSSVHFAELAAERCGRKGGSESPAPQTVCKGRPGHLPSTGPVVCT